MANEVKHGETTLQNDESSDYLVSSTHATVENQSTSTKGSVSTKVDTNSSPSSSTRTATGECPTRVVAASELNSTGANNLSMAQCDASRLTCMSSSQRCECALINWLSVQNDKAKQRTIRDAVLAHFTKHGAPIRDVYDAQLIGPTSTNSSDHRKMDTTKCAFGGQLSTLRSEFIDEIGFVPRLLMTMCQVVRSNVKTEYLFRKSGLHVLHKKLRERIEKAYSGASVNNNYNESWLLQNVDDTHRVTVHDVTYLLKAFFGELREPLLTTYFEPHFLKCIEHFRARAQRVRAVIFLCWLLPHDHLATLVYFARLLADVAAHSATNHMNAHALATICAPKLIRLSDDIDSSSIRDQRILNLKIGVIETLIENAHLIGHVPACLLRRVDTPDVSGPFSLQSPVKRRLPTDSTSMSNTPDVSLTGSTRKRHGQNSHSIQTPNSVDDSTQSPSAGVSKKRRSKSVHGFLALANAFKLRKPRQSGNESSARVRREPARPDSTSTDNTRGGQSYVEAETRFVVESTAVFDCSNPASETNASSSIQAAQIRIGKTCMPIPLVRKRKSDTRLGDSNASKSGTDALTLALVLTTDSDEIETQTEVNMSAPRGSAMTTFKRRVFQQTLDSIRRDGSKPCTTPVTTQVDSDMNAVASMRVESCTQSNSNHVTRARQRFERELQNLSPIRLSPHRPVTRHLSALSSTSESQNQTSCLSPGDSRLRCRSRSVRQQPSESARATTATKTPCPARNELSAVQSESHVRCIDNSCLSTPLQCVASEDSSMLNGSTGSRKLRRGQPNAVHNGLVHPPTRIASRRTKAPRVPQSDDEKENVIELRHTVSTTMEECTIDAKRQTAGHDSQSPLTGRNACPPKVKDTVLRFEELTARQLRSASGINVSNGSTGARLLAYRVTPLCVNSSLASTETSI